MSHLFGRTLRAAPGDVASQQLLVRAGYIRPVAAGIFSSLPLGFRAMRKIEAIIREEMDAIGGQELAMPVVHPAELWQKTGRWYEVGDELVRFRDRGDRDMVLGMTHEELVAQLAAGEVESHRQLPLLVYQFQTKFRDEPRPRAGLIRVREFTMKDSYSLDADEAGLERQYRAHHAAYVRIFGRVGLDDVVAVRADPGMMGGGLAEEFMFPSPIGEDTLALCDACGDAANLQIASFRKPAPAPEAPRPLERVATPGASTIETLAASLGVPRERTAKAIFFTAAVPAPGGPGATRDAVVMAMVRGDMDLSETKLARAIGARSLRPASLEAIRAIGAEPGYASPIGVGPEAIVVVDDLVAASSNLVAGANAAGFHYLNANAGRDYQPGVVADVAAAFAGAPCERCGGPLRLARGIEVGNIFRLGTRYAEALGATYRDAAGLMRPIVMGSYGIGIGRLLACVAEAHHDDRGLGLPVTVAPFAVHLVRLHAGDDAIARHAERLYGALGEAGVEVLYDDRDASAGVKFTDADLIGLPLRVTVSERSVREGGAEVKRRDQRVATIVPMDGAANALRDAIAGLGADLHRRVRVRDGPGSP